MSWLDSLLGRTSLGDMRREYYNDRVEGTLGAMNDLSGTLTDFGGSMAGRIGDMINMGASYASDLSGLAGRIEDRSKGFFDINSAQNVGLRNAIGKQSMDQLAMQNLMARRNAAAAGNVSGGALNAQLAAMGNRSQEGALSAFNKGYLGNMQVGAGLLGQAVNARSAAGDVAARFAGVGAQFGSLANQAYQTSAGLQSNILGYHQNVADSINTARIDNAHRTGDFWGGLVKKGMELAGGGLGSLLGGKMAAMASNGEKIPGWLSFVGGMFGQNAGSYIQNANMQNMLGGFFSNMFGQGAGSSTTSYEHEQGGGSSSGWNGHPWVRQWGPA